MLITGLYIKKDKEGNKTGGLSGKTKDGVWYSVVKNTKKTNSPEDHKKADYWLFDDREESKPEPTPEPNNDDMTDSDGNKLPF